jgi:cystathionine gamma-lyase
MKAPLSRAVLESRIARALHVATQSTAEGAAFDPPIVNSSIYALPGPPQGPYQYGRWSNPTWTALEEALGILEDARVVAFPSGMAAIAAVFHALLRAGDRILLPSDGYYTTRVVAEKYLAPLGIGVDTCVSRELPNHLLAGYRLIFVETPTNPGLDVVDIAAVAEQAHANGAIVVVDNTMMTPLGQQPLEWGADIVVCADTKAINGHSDVVFGHVATRDERWFSAITDWRKYAGAIPGAFEAWLVHRGLETLELRFARMSSNAEAVAERLLARQGVADVRYPGLANHPQHALARQQMTSSGTIVAFTLADAATADRFVRECDCVRSATSFGGVHSSAERRARWGDAVAPGFIRLSVGCEPLEVLWQSIDAALSRAMA